MKTLLCFFITLLVGCTARNERRAMVEEFIHSVVVKNYKKINAYTTESCHRFLNSGIYKVDYITSAFECSILKDSLSADKMSCWVWYKDKNNKNSQIYIMYLIKLRDKWTIDNPCLDLVTITADSSEINNVNLKGRDKL